MTSTGQNEESDNGYEFDPNTGIPRRLSAAERRARKETADAKRAKAAPRKGKAKSPKHAKTPSGNASTRLVDDDKDNSSGVFPVDLPGGGQLILSTPAEKNYFDAAKRRYQTEYALTKPNDLSRLGQLLVAELEAWRLMQRMAGQVPKFDNQGKISGYEKVSEDERREIPKALTDLQKEIRFLEGALKIDKKTREIDSGDDIRSYMESLKKAGIQYGIHLSDRYKAYDDFVNEVRWRLRVLENPDVEDRKYHKLESPSDLTDWMSEELNKLEDIDKKFAANKQSLWMARNIP